MLAWSVKVYSYVFVDVFVDTSMCINLSLVVIEMVDLLRIAFKLSEISLGCLFQLQIFYEQDTISRSH